MDIIYIIGGLAALLVGGELLVRCAISLAKGLGLSPMIIGLTVLFALLIGRPPRAVSVRCAETG